MFEGPGLRCTPQRNQLTEIAMTDCCADEWLYTDQHFVHRVDF